MKQVKIWKGWDFFPRKYPIKLLEEYERWREVAKELKLSREARLRLDWIIHYCQGNTTIETARHFGISKKTFYKWFGQFDRDNLYTLHCLEDKSKAPKRVRQREITDLQEQRVIQLRKKYIRYGKMKLAKIYETMYQEKISSWKVQKVIESYQLYYNPIKTARTARKRATGQKKKRITELQLDTLKWYEKKSGYIVCLDTIVIHWNSVKRYIFTAVDKYGKVAYARMYKTKSTQNSEDFLYRLYFLLDGKIPRVGHDNGTEFEKYFKAACVKLKIQQYYSRVRTPKDNPNNERFNRTLQEEFIQLGNFHSDPVVFNRNLTEWLIEYNFHRPHTALNYQTPMEFSRKLPMYSSCTRI
jgi:transposase InsO family protein